MKSRWKRYEHDGISGFTLHSILFNVLVVPLLKCKWHRQKFCWKSLSLRCPLNDSRASFLALGIDTDRYCRIMRPIQRALKYSGRAGCQERALPLRLHSSSAMDMGIPALSFLKVTLLVLFCFALHNCIYHSFASLPACLLTSLRLQGLLSG